MRIPLVISTDKPLHLFTTILLAIILSFSAAFLAGCGAASSSKDAHFELPSTNEVSQAYDGKAAPRENLAAGSVNIERKIIQNADLILKVDDVTACADRISVLTQQLGGYLVNSRQYRYQDKITANLSVKVPADKLTGMLETVSGYGEISDKTISTEDVTEEYYDAEARLKVLEAKETRLLALFDRANTITDIVSVEKELGEVRSNIEVIKGRLKYLNNATSFSTVNITLEQAVPGTLKAPQGTMGKAWRGLVNSLNTMVDFGSNLVIYVIIILPWIIAGGILFLVIRYLFRRFKNKRTAE